MKRWMCCLLVLMLAAGLAPCALAETEEDDGLVAVNLQAIKAVLDRNDLTFTFREEGDSFYVGFDLENKMESCTMWLIAYDDGVLIQCDLDVRLEPERVNDLAIYLMRCNSMVRMGNFYIDEDEDVVGYEIFILSDVLPPTQDALKWAMALSLAMLETRGDAIYDIMMNGISAEEALSRYP